MLFNSIHFAVFFPVVTVLYFALPHRARWAWLLAASSYFYCVFIPVYILILGFTIVVDYAAGLLIERAEGNGRRLLLATSIAANVGVLGLFKYYDFAATSLATLAASLGVSWRPPLLLGIALPLGLSFHTFQAMSYTIEVYRGRQRAERHFGIYALYVMFYPQLVAGPIERPYNMLHQFHERHRFEYGRVTDGLRRMLWGLFKKVVVADRLAPVVDAAYGAPLAHGGAGLVLATYCFAIQIYCDFSGYSDVALGAARVMGFRLMENFDRPYGAASLAEFWHRWHVSLSTWFRDYLYIPLGGNRVSTPRRYANVLVVFLVSGLWHGASWTFVVWGAVHGLGLVASELAGRGAHAARAAPRRIVRAIRVVLTFNLVCAAWVFFRAPTVADAKVILWRMVSPDAWLRAADLDLVRANAEALWVGGVGTLVMLAVEALQGDRTVGESARRLPLPARWAAYYALILAIVFVGGGASHRFIYFQF